MNAHQKEEPAARTTGQQHVQQQTNILSDGGACKWPEWAIDDLAKSGLTPEVVERWGWRPLRPEGMAEVLGFAPSDSVDGYAIPFHDPATGKAMHCADGERPVVRVRLAKAIALDPTKPDKTARYLAPKNAGCQPFILPEVAAHLMQNPDAPVLVTEGEKKCACALQHGLHVVGLTGIYCWKAAKGRGELHPALIPYLAGRRVVMIYDSDARDKDKRLTFNRCAEQFASAVEGHGATLQRVDLPSDDATGKIGLDDYLQSGKTVEGLLRLVEAAARPVQAKRPVVCLPGAGVGMLQTVRELAPTIETGGEIFTRAGELVRIDGAGFVPLTPAEACSEFERFASFEALRQGSSGVTSVPAVLTEYKVRPLLASPELHRRLPTIERVADYPMPVRGADGQVRVTRRGYDRGTRTWTVPDAPELVVPATVEQAVAILDELLQDFCFADAPEGCPDGLYRAAAMAMLLTPHVRFLIEPERAPVFLATGNRPGCGKDFLLGLPVVLATGRMPEYSPPPGDPEETRKRLFAAARTGESFVIFSNVKRRLDNAALESFATASEVTDRVLGVSDSRSYPNTPIYAISGNSLRLSEDMTRRCVPIRFAYFEEDLDARVFRHPDLHGYALEHRGRCLGALERLTLKWCEKGCPAGARRMTGFGRWSDAIGGILEAAGESNPIAVGDLGDDEDQDTAQMAALMKAVSEDHGETEIAADEVRRIAEERGLFTHLGNFDDHGPKCKFGRLLGAWDQRELGGLKLLRKTSGKTKQVRVVELQPSG